MKQIATYEFIKTTLKKYVPLMDNYSDPLRSATVISAYATPSVIKHHEHYIREILLNLNNINKKLCVGVDYYTESGITLNSTTTSNILCGTNLVDSFLVVYDETGKKIGKNGPFFMPFRNTFYFAEKKGKLVCEIDFYGRKQVQDILDIGACLVESHLNGCIAKVTKGKNVAIVKFAASEHKALLNDSFWMGQHYRLCSTEEKEPNYYTKICDPTYANATVCEFIVNEYADCPRVPYADLYHILIKGEEALKMMDLIKKTAPLADIVLLDD
jgi:hypothetical protein